MRLSVLVASLAATLPASRTWRVAGHAGSRVVRMTQFSFDPAEAVVAVGDTVVWENADIVPHTSTADSGRWQSGELAVGSRYRYVVTDTGRFSYHCGAHPVMRGLLIVR